MWATTNISLIINLAGFIVGLIGLGLFVVAAYKNGLVDADGRLINTLKTELDIVHSDNVRQQKELDALSAENHHQQLLLDRHHLAMAQMQTELQQRSSLDSVHIRSLVKQEFAKNTVQSMPDQPEEEVV